ncbi:MAG: DNA integrity scanning diadenylate cyclase DisA [Acidimicrobiia bacterium]|nr:DNA integrity scanning diadenylate cyclase DisA [Acidimicrobiia bacterium]
MSQVLPPRLLQVLRTVAPGQPMREGLDRILQAGMGALVVVGSDPDVLSICRGGFLVDAAFSPQRLFELAKMDGAIILDADGGRIARANVHLVPDPDVATTETGTRHRTAERVARSLGMAVITVSEERSVVWVYVDDHDHNLEPARAIVFRADQALQTLSRYRHRLDDISTNLTALELQDLVTLRDVLAYLQRSEVVRRISEEIESDLAQLGTEGRLIRLQLAEVMAGVDDDRRLVIRDYFREDETWHLTEALRALSDLGGDGILDLDSVVSVLHLPADQRDLDTPVQPRGHRVLSRLPRLPVRTAETIIERFGTLDAILATSTDRLVGLDGLDEAVAASLKADLGRLTESSILDRYS